MDIKDKILWKTIYSYVFSQLYKGEGSKQKRKKVENRRRGREGEGKKEGTKEEGREEKKND